VEDDARRADAVADRQRLDERGERLGADLRVLGAAVKPAKSSCE
jgi:hypothetical protein